MIENFYSPNLYGHDFFKKGLIRQLPGSLRHADRAFYL